MTDSLNLPFLLLCVISLVWLSRTVLLLRSLKILPKVASLPFSGESRGLVSIIVPMKNEAVNAAACVECLKAQDYPDFEIIIANDNSTDGTEEILKKSAVRYVNVPPTPEGWTGKNFAIHTAAAGARGAWLLFTDADTRHERTSVSSAVRHAGTRGIQMLTLFPRCLAEGFFENLIQPAAMTFTGLWFPVEKINNPDSPVYFGNGQYLMIERGLYEKTGGHQAVRGEFLEDFAFMKRAKEMRAPVQCALGAEIYGTRMYDSLNTLWKGWRRIYLHAFRSRPLELLHRLFSVFFFSIMPALLVIAGFTVFPDPVFLSAACALQIWIYIICWKSYGIVRAKKEFAFLHPLAAFFISLMLADAAWIAATKQKTVWR